MRSRYTLLINKHPDNDKAGRQEEEMKRKIAAILLSASMALGLLTGCGGQGTAGDGSAQNTAS